jgi:hypothetical protein
MQSLKARGVYGCTSEPAIARRIALVAAAPLARMQSNGFQIREDVVIFDGRSAAETGCSARQRNAKGRLPATLKRG